MKPDWTQESPWNEQASLTGIMRPVHEEITVAPCEVEGSIPPELDGLLVRNGPNQRFEPRTKTYHFFDGDGMAHGLRIEGGEATYRNRWVRTECFEMQVEAGRSLWGGIMDNPLLVRPPRGAPRFKAHGGVNTVWHAGKLLALDEIGLPWELDPNTLETVGTHDFDGRWKGPMTPHPKFDTATGEMITFGYDVGRRPLLDYAVVDPDGTMSHVVSIDVPKPVMIHDFAITERFSIIPDVPIVFSMARGLLGGPVFKFDARRPLRFGVLPRRGGAGDVRWFEASPAALMHVLCAWEEEDEIVVVGCRMTQFEIGLGNLNPTAPGYDSRIGEGAPQLCQWRLDLRTGLVRSEEVLDERPMEFPRINDQVMGRSTQWGYTMDVRMDRHYKVDLRTGVAQEHVHGPGRYCYEMIFVPHPEPQAEDHGWLVGYVYDAERDTSEAVLIDAQHFSAPPLARIRIPQRVPMGAHGVWVSGDELRGG